MREERIEFMYIVLMGLVMRAARAWQSLSGHHAHVLTGWGWYAWTVMVEYQEIEHTKPPLAKSEMSTTRGIPIYKEAIRLGEHGFHIFPVRVPINGYCSCGKATCDSPGKHPHIKGFLQLATTNTARIASWWSQWPDANIGIVCGHGLIVIDIDGKEGEAWIAEREMPITLSATSGRGRHLYYRGSATGGIDIAPKVDLLGSGRYVVAPPSLHPSGVRYEWCSDPMITPMTKAPEWVLKATTTSRAITAANSTERAKREASSRKVTFFYEGQRNDGLFTYGCSMRRQAGMTTGEVEGALLIANDERCRPPLGRGEVRDIARSAVSQPRHAPTFKELRDSGLIPSELAVVNALLAEANAMGECTIDYKTLAKYAMVSQSTAQRAVKRLKQRKMIKTNFRPFKSLRYVIEPVETWLPSRTTPVSEESACSPDGSKGRSEQEGP